MTHFRLAPYSHEIYHSTTKPSLHEALGQFHSTKAINAVNTVVRDCFLNQNVQKHFTACINHRHFDLSPDERNIEEPDGRAMASTDHRNIVPCSWLFCDGKLYPYEFKRVPDSLKWEEVAPPADFVDELGTILEGLGLCDVIGIQAYTEGVVGMEGTDREKRVSTTESYTEGEERVERDGAVIASFAFF